VEKHRYVIDKVKRFSTITYERGDLTIKDIELHFGRKIFRNKRIS